jgi:flagellar hook-associated protein 1 FlgK
MSLFGCLSSGASALDAQSYALQIAGKNIANVNNQNYARETVNIGAGPATQTAQGCSSFNLEAQSVTQIRNAFLDQQVAQEDSIVSGLTTEQSALQQAESSLGETVSSGTSASTSAGAGASLSSQLTGLFNAFQSLAASPTGSGAAQTLVENASSFCDQLNQTDSALAQIQTGLTGPNGQIQSTVGDINKQLTTIAGLNSQIAVAEAGKPGSAVDLRDQRQAAIESLAADMSFTTSTDSNGQMALTTTDANGNTVALVDGATVSNTVGFNGTALTAGGASLALTSGSVQGALNASGVIQTLRDGLDALSKQVVTSVNAAFNPTGATGNFFAATGITAATIAVDPTLTSSSLVAASTADAGAAAANVAKLANYSFSTGSGDSIDGTMTQFYANTVSAFGQTLSDLNNQVENQTAVQTMVTSQRQSVSGVNLDEETTNLMMYQKAYQASAQYLNIIDGLLSNLVQLGSSLS